MTSKGPFVPEGPHMTCMCIGRYPLCQSWVLCSKSSLNNISGYFVSVFFLCTLYTLRIKSKIQRKMQSTTTDEKVEYNRISLEDSDLEPGDSLLSHQNSSKNKRNNALSIANPSWAVWIHVALGIIWVLLFGLLTFMRTSNTGESPDHTSKYQRDNYPSK